MLPSPVTSKRLKAVSMYLGGVESRVSRKQKSG